MKITRTHPSILESLNITYAEEALINRLRNSGYTEDEIFCYICEYREYRECIEGDSDEDEMDDWYDTRINPARSL